MAETEDLPLLLFRVEHTIYAVPAAQVAYVEMPEHITPVPRTPAYVEGVMYSRGAIVPVVNLRVRFGLPRQPRDLRQRVIVTQQEQRTVGLLVDEAREFLRLPAGRVMLPPDTVVTPGADFLSGVAVEQGRLIFLVDLERILSPEEVTALPEDLPAPLAPPKPDPKNPSRAQGG